MTDPPPLPPPPGGEPPTRLQATRTWSLLTGAPLVAHGFHPRGAWMLDRAGRLTVVEANGEVIASRLLGSRPRRAVRPHGGGLLVLEDDAIASFDGDGNLRWRRPVMQPRALAVGARGILVSCERIPLLVLSHAGHERERLQIAHPSECMVSCSRTGHVLAAASTGHVSLIGPAGVVWTKALNMPIRDVSGAENGVFVLACADFGLQVGDVDVGLTGVVDHDEPLHRCAISGEGGHALGITLAGSIFLVDLASGWSAWRDHRDQRFAHPALSRDGSNALLGLEGGAVESLDFSREESGRTARLELRDAPSVAAALWRHADATLTGIPPSGHFTLAPNGELLAMTDPAWHEIRLFDRTGRAATSLDGLVAGTRIAFSGNASEILLHDPGHLVLIQRASRSRKILKTSAVHVQPGRDGFVATAVQPNRLLMLRGGVEALEVPLPAAPRQLAASEDLATIAVALADGTLAAWGRDGATTWRRWHAERAGSLAVAGALVLVMDDGCRLSGLGDEGQVRFEAELEGAAALFVVEGQGFARLGATRFIEIHDTGIGRTVDRGGELGWSTIAALPDGTRCELSIVDAWISAFDLDGRLVWRFEADDSILVSDLAHAGGMLACRAGSALVLLSLGSRTSNAAARGSFLET